MYLTKLELNLNNNSTVSTLMDVNKLHKMVMYGFPDLHIDKPREKMNILFELNEGKRSYSILVQSDEKPNYDRLVMENKIKKYDTKEISFNNVIKNGMKVRLEILSQPFVKVSNSYSKNSRRMALSKEEDKLKWFQRKMQQNGCRVIADAVRSTDRTVFGMKNENKIKYYPSLYSCMVVVENKDAFLNAVKTGIGSGKAYGMGMLKVFL